MAKIVKMVNEQQEIAAIPASIICHGFGSAMVKDAPSKLPAQLKQYSLKLDLLAKMFLSH
jgi:hypothetical protein